MITKKNALTLSTYAFFPQKAQLYLACWVTSIFLMTFLKVPPYLVPYLPTMPAFLVCFACSNHNNKPTQQRINNLFAVAMINHKMVRNQHSSPSNTTNITTIFPYSATRLTIFAEFVNKLNHFELVPRLRSHTNSQPKHSQPRTQRQRTATDENCGSHKFNHSINKSTTRERH
jgi:hypothetical protein